VRLCLIGAFGLLFFFAPIATRGMPGLRPLAWEYAALMFLNGLGDTLFSILGHTVSSVTFPRPAPGFYSALFLFAVARHEVSFSTLVEVVLCVSSFICGPEVERRGPDYCVGVGRFLSWCNGIHHRRTKTLEIASGLPKAD